MATPFVPPSEPIQPLGLVGPTPQPVPNIETRTEEQYFQDVTTPTGPKPIRPDLSTPPPADPFAEFQDAGFEQFQDAPDEFANFKTADDLDIKSVEELDKDRESFRPADYFSSNPDVAKDPKKLAKLLEVYRRRDEEGLTAKGVAKAAVKNAPGLLADIGGGIKRLGERAIDVVVQPTANVVLGTLTGDIFDDQKRAALFNETRKTIKKGVGEVAAGSEAATVGLVDLARTGARKVPYTGTEFEPIPLPKPKTDQELLKQLADDASFRQNAEAIAKGEGEAAKNFGLDKETLAQQGITMDENAIRQLSLVDPITMVATGGAFKVLGVGGKVLATAATIEGAEQFVDKLAKLSKVAVGKTVQGTGKAASFVGEKLQGTGRSAALITGVGTAMRGGSAIESLAMAAAAKATGPAIRKAGGMLEHAGKALAGEVPVSANLQKVLDYAVKPAAGVAGSVGKGTLEGIAAASPFAVAAQDDETAGALLGAGAGIGAVGSTGANAFRVVKRGASRRYFGENRPVLPDVASPGYGKDAALDAIHDQNIAKLSAQDASEVNNFREALRQQGGEIYAVDQKTFREKVAEGMRDNGIQVTPEQLNNYENHSAFFDTSKGDRKVVYLNSDTTGLMHDAGHIFDAVLSPEKRAELRSAVESAFTPEQRKQFRDTYERRVGNKISDTAAVDEFIAEQFAALFNNVPVTELNAPKSLLNKFIDTAAEAAESLGIDLSNGAQTPNLGAPVSVGIRQLFRNAAGDVIRANIEGVPPTNVTPFPGGPTPPTGGAPVPPPVAPTAPAAPVPATPAPVVPPPPPSNVTPLPGVSRNIRVAPEEVAAFKQSASPDVRAAADARARETGVDYARTEAKKNDGSPTSQIIERISDSMESGRPVVQIEHLGITSESTPEAPLGRTARRGEQSAGYAALEAAQLDVRQNAPAEIVSQHSKNFVPVRWTDQGGSPTLIAMSLDKVIANMMKIAADPKAKDLIPYPVENGKFTPEGWREVVSDAQKYAENQANGRKGDGGRLEVPEAGLSIPAENPAYTPQILSPERANFQNLVQGIAPPQTARAQKGTIPGNVKGQVLAEANRRATETPANITPKRADKQAFAEFPGRTVQETNPLRNEMERRGVKTRELIEVTERIRAKDIVDAKPRPDVNFQAPVTDTIRGGFLPQREFWLDRAKETPEEATQKILAATPAEWNAAVEGQPFRPSERLNLPLDPTRRAEIQNSLTNSAKAALDAGNTEAAGAYISKKKFFADQPEQTSGPANFLPNPDEFKQKFVADGNVDEFAKTVLNATPEEWKAATDSMAGGLTGGAWNLGLGLTDKSVVPKLLKWHQDLSQKSKDAMLKGDFDTAMTEMTKGQFFREAYEAATGTGSALSAFKNGRMGDPTQTPPFPFAEKTKATAATSGDTTVINIGETGQFLPAEELIPGTTESQPDVSVVPPAAGGTRPPNEPPLPSQLRPPPVAAGFLPQKDEKKVLDGTAFKDFFSKVTKGEFGKSEVPWVPLKDVSKSSEFLNTVTKHSGNFDEHIAKSIPGYRETQIQKGDAIVKSYPNGARVLDIGGSEGAWDKAISEQSGGKIETVVADPNPDMAAFFRTKSTVPGASYSESAWVRGFEDNGKQVPKFEDSKPFDVINESMVFQFISPERAEQVAEAKKHLKPDGIFLSDEKLRTTPEEWTANEAKKDKNYKAVYFSNDELKAKDKVVGFQQAKSESKAVGMIDNMANVPDYEQTLLNNFAHVVQYWDSGNFKGYAASDSLPALDKFLNALGETKTDFSTTQTPRIVEQAGFLPKTEAGRKLEERGFSIVPSGELGMRRVAILKDGDEVAAIQSVQRAPSVAEIAMVQKYAGAPKGVGEVLYREIGAQLKADGVKELTGNVISPEPLAIRKKVFGDFKSIDLNGEPATLEQALATAARVKDRTENEVAAIEPVSTISENSRFLPKVKRDEQGRPLKKNGDIDYERWQAEGIAARKKRERERDEELPVSSVGPEVRNEPKATGWILPDKKFVPLDTNFHEQYLAQNADALNKKFGTEFTKDEVAGIDDRLNALNAGFVRLRNYNGRLSVEANAAKWSALKSKTLRTLQDVEGQIDSLSVSLLNDKGQEVDSVTVPRLFELGREEKLNKIEEAIDGVRASGPRFLPRGDSSLPGFEAAPDAGAVTEAKRRIAYVKRNHPEAVIPQYARDENGQIMVRPDGAAKTLTIEYDLANSPKAKEAAKGKKGEARTEAITDDLADGLEKFYNKIKDNPEIRAGEKWYSTARTRLRRVFGDDSRFFAELLGATSARTAVEVNFKFALEAYNQFKLGAYDKILAKYREGKAMWENGDLAAFTKATKNTEPTRGQFLDWWVDKHDLNVTQSNGKKFGMNSRQVLKVLDGSWASEVQGPKTPNFTGNLTGETFEATIDIWAARLLRRLGYEEAGGRWRILPENETGVTDADFYLGQGAFRKAADRLGIKPDSLQAILWFAEKEHWNDRGWTRAAGGEKSDFNSLLNETERTEEGTVRMKSPQIGLDFGAEIGNISKKKK